MGSNMSSGTDGHVQCIENRRKCSYSKITAGSAQKDDFSTVKNGRFHYFFSPILFLTLLDIPFQWGLLPSVVFCHCPLDDNG
jgi:hypothetical protein